MKSIYWTLFSSGVKTPLEGSYYRLSVGVTGDPVSEAAADEVNKHAGRGKEISEEEVERFILESFNGMH